MENNKVTMAGYAETDFVIDHEIYGERFFKIFISVKRESGTVDMIPVIVSERLFDVSKSICGEHVIIHGEFRSYNKKTEIETHLLLFVFASEFCITYSKDRINEAIVEGFICRKPTFRTTPFGREVSDMILAVHRFYGKSDYIPCICWGRSAKFAYCMNVGDRVQITGRIQSRQYIKVIDGIEEERTAYEISANDIQKLEQ